MTLSRYLTLAFVAIFSATALAQAPSDSVVVRAPGIEAPGRTAQFGAQLEEGVPVGPLPLSIADPIEACDGPLTNADQIEGTIVLISRGTCAFADKLLHAAEAGAVAAVVMNNDSGLDVIMPMFGDCTVQQGCSIPGAFVTFSDSFFLLNAAKAGDEAVIDPIRITPPPVDAEPTPGEPSGALALGAPYPNPSYGSATLPLALPAATEVRVAVYDVLGRAVAVVHDGPLASGAHTLSLDTAALPLGIYSVRATAGGFTTAQRFTSLH